MAGLNTLDFVVNNFFNGVADPGPTGLRVELTGMAEPDIANHSIPEPTTLAIWRAGALALALYRRRSKRFSA